MYGIQIPLAYLSPLHYPSNELQSAERATPNQEQAKKEQKKARGRKLCLKGKKFQSELDKNVRTFCFLERQAIQAMLLRTAVDLECGRCLA
jgi:hypothetical protein